MNKYLIIILKLEFKLQIGMFTMPDLKYLKIFKNSFSVRWYRRSFTCKWSGCLPDLLSWNFSSSCGSFLRCEGCNCETLTWLPSWYKTERQKRKNSSSCRRWGKHIYFILWRRWFSENLTFKYFRGIFVSSKKYAALPGYGHECAQFSSMYFPLTSCRLYEIVLLSWQRFYS